MNKNIKNLNDEIFTLNAEFSADTRVDKINGGIGIYLDNIGQPFVIPIVKKIASSLDFSNFNYLPISGDPVFLEESSKLVLGNSLYKEYKNKIIKQGTDGGTNGLFIWASLIKFTNPNPTIIVSNPTWENHKKIFKHCGFNVVEYNHINKLGFFDFESFQKTISKYPDSFILFHGGSTHNPTGVNPSTEEWKKISQITKKNNNYVLFDFAYLGLGENIEKDSFPIRHFLEKKNKIAVVISYSKNMTLYQHRVGVLLIPTLKIKAKENNETIIKYLFRLVNQTPTAFGEIIVKNVLSNQEYKKEWIKSLSEMNKNIQKRRELFNQYTNNLFSEVVHQKGLYSLLKITPKQTKILKNKHGIYLLSTGRINFGGLAINKIPKLTEAINSLKI
ncbi:MAG: aminotransferase class I/II-fold pyridoxal phosphate-dependent enzyme [Candidatus Shapirobacteria bacterium]|jgi:aspartate aminotransferase